MSKPSVDVLRKQDAFKKMTDDLLGHCAYFDRAALLLLLSVYFGALLIFFFFFGSTLRRNQLHRVLPNSN